MAKKILIGLGSIFLLFFMFLVWFKISYSMEEANGFELNSAKLDQKVLIVTQGSEYKKSIVENIKEEFTDKNAYLKVVDIKKLKKVKAKEWDAIVIMHTWEIFEPEERAKKFLKKHYDASKMFVVSTSASGDNNIDGVDGITSASELTNVSKDSRKIIDWLKTLIEL